MKAQTRQKELVTLWQAKREVIGHSAV